MWRKVWIVVSIAAAGTAAAQPLPPSPYDVNPECTRRNVDPNAPECVLPQEGEPRHTYPPPRVYPPKQPQQPPPAQQPTSPPAQQRDFNSPAQGGKLR